MLGSAEHQGSFSPVLSFYKMRLTEKGRDASDVAA